MRKISDYVEHIKDELEGSYCYAETYIDCKASGNNERANAYRKFSQDELDHATGIHSFAVQDIERIRKVYPNPPTEMQREWERVHLEMIEKTAVIKNMLSM